VDMDVSFFHQASCLCYWQLQLCCSGPHLKSSCNCINPADATTELIHKDIIFIEGKQVLSALLLVKNQLTQVRAI
jgi:hypothetical protein